MYRVFRIDVDNGCFGYTAPPVEKLIIETADLAVAKKVYRHYSDENFKLIKAGNVWAEFIGYRLESVGDEYCDISQDWGYTEYEKMQEWFEAKGYNWMDYIMKGE